VSDPVVLTRATTLRGSVRVPGDKSTSHRALMLSALADGESSIEGLSPGLDVAATSAILTQLGARRRDEGLVLVEGPSEGLRPSPEALECNNSGTTMRLMAGILSGVAGDHVLTGDDSLSTRPMDRVAQPLALMGATVHGQGPRVTAPLHIRGTSSLQGIAYHVPMASAQVKSAILLAALAATGTTSIVEDVRTRTTTETMLRDAGIEIEVTDLGAGRRVRVVAGRPRTRHWLVPGDPSQAAFFCVLATIHDDADVKVLAIDASPERTGFIGVLQRMGSNLTSRPEGSVTTLEVQSSTLRATEVHAHEIPSVDEVPVLVVAAAAAEGVSAFRGMGELRLKESDRFEGSMTLASLLGCRVWSEDDDFFVEGLSSARAFREFSVDAALDHRMVMAGAVAATAGHGGAVRGAETVSSSYPQFFDDVASLQ